VLALALGAVAGSADPSAPAPNPQQIDIVTKATAINNLVEIGPAGPSPGDRILELVTDDIEYRDDAWPRTMHGHREVGEFLEAAWRGIPDMTFELVSGPYVIPGAPRAAFRWRGWGTHTGVLDPPGFAPTGRRWEIDGADFHEYRDGRLSRLRVAFDMMSVSRQLGLMPAAGSRAERALALAQRSAVQAQRAIQRRRRQA
jgi:predicted ester cyclase